MKASAISSKHLVPETSLPSKAASPTQQQLSSPMATPVNLIQEKKTSWANVVSESPTAAFGANAAMPSAQLPLKSAGGVPPSVGKNSSRKPVKIDFEDIIDKVHF